MMVRVMIVVVIDAVILINSSHEPSSHAIEEEPVDIEHKMEKEKKIMIG